MRTIIFILAGYLSGSILFAPLWGRILCGRDITEGTPDGNPGTANAFQKGGFLCGTLTLLCDLAKGFVPVWLYLRQAQVTAPALAFVLAAPVFGHIFSFFHHFHGGKGIAVSFGSLLGLYPYIACALILAACFIGFSTVLVISPHYYRTLVSYLTASA